MFRSYGDKIKAGLGSAALYATSQIANYKNVFADNYTAGSCPCANATNQISSNSGGPEFSAVAAIVLSVAIVGIIVATARYGSFKFRPRL
jgi:hypothetical protein